MTKLWVSPTQLSCHSLCNRKWWFLHAQKVPTLPQTHFAFGTVLHAVCERYLEADELGRSADGEPVDLYPEGWHVDDRGVELSMAERALVRQLVDKAIEAGVLVRQPGALVEHRIRRKMSPNVMFVGVIDHLCPDGIEDHKTTKAMRWALSKDKLSKDQQMLLYGYEWMQRRIESGAAVPAEVRLQHNVFVKDPDAPAVRKTTVYTTPREIDDAWARALEQARQMIRHREIDDWHSFEDPDPGACMAYGGCEMRSVCGGQETFKGYCTRVERLLKDRYSPQSSGRKPAGSTSNNKNNMGLRDRIAAAKKRGTQTAVNDGPTSTAEAPSKPAGGKLGKVKAAKATKASKKEDPQTEPWGDTPPWAVEGCKVCSGKHPGFNSKGGICRACKNKTTVDLDAWEIFPGDDGSICWTDGETEGRTFISADAEASEKIAEPPPPTAPATPEDEVDDADDEDTDDDDEDTDDEDEAAAPTAKRRKRRGPGRPPAGPKLLIGVTPIKGIRQERIQHASDVLARYGEILAKESDVASYYAIPAYDRRSAIASIAAQIAKDLGSDYLLVSNPENPDVEAMVSSLIPFAEQVLMR